jgi:hypothetical protein
MAGDDQPLVPAKVGAGHHVVAHPFDRQAAGLAQALLHMVGQSSFLMALGTDRHQVGRASEKVGHAGHPRSGA